MGERSEGRSSGGGGGGGGGSSSSRSAQPQADRPGIRAQRSRSASIRATEKKASAAKHKAPIMQFLSPEKLQARVETGAALIAHCSVLRLSGYLTRVPWDPF